MHIVMIAAENGTLPGGKVGGIGDVIRDVPLALARAGHRVSVVTPGYQRLSRLPGAELKNTLTVEFCGSLETVSLHKVAAATPVEDVEHWVIEHPLFAACGEGRIYCDDQWGPFATDAHKFALFSNAVCHCLLTGAIREPDILHLHDWHAAMVLFLREYLYPKLRRLPAVYTIHNLSIQGIRPFAENGSSLEAWFAISDYRKQAIADPVTPSCVNMMRMGINMADRVHVVSPTYAQEIKKPSNARLGYVGGEGLEQDIQEVDRQGKLFGILNGCEYPAGAAASITKASFIKLANQCLLDWVGDETYISTAYFFAQQRLMAWSAKRGKDSCVVASVGRLTSQKVSLLEQEVSPGVSALDRLLDQLEGGIYIMLGSGDHQLENFMSGTMARHENFIFLKGYSDQLSDALYRFCDLFLMPSTFEPCGISQMLAMRAGKPCLVHGVGGLADTVKQGVNGFSFAGKNPGEQCRLMLKTLQEALSLKKDDPGKWRKISKAASEARFSWDQSIHDYMEKLYRIGK